MIQGVYLFHAKFCIATFPGHSHGVGRERDRVRRRQDDVQEQDGGPLSRRVARLKHREADPDQEEVGASWVSGQGQGVLRFHFLMDPNMESAFSAFQLRTWGQVAQYSI